MKRVGIGIVTYNRAAALAMNLALTLKFTPGVHAVIVADDESNFDTPELLVREFRGSGVHYCRGRNMGVAWNKNRALYFLNNLRKCDYVILLEDDSFPMQAGWEDIWLEGAERYGHINLAAPWFPTPFRCGGGTVANPFIGQDVTAQCAAFSAEALEVVGFMDTRFQRNGYAHPEHSYRMAKAGYGGTVLPDGGVEYYMIDSPICVLPEKTYAGDPQMLAVNRQIYLAIKEEGVHRLPWRGGGEFEQLQSEMKSVRAL